MYPVYTLNELTTLYIRTNELRYVYCRGLINSNVQPNKVYMFTADTTFDVSNT